MAVACDSTDWKASSRAGLLFLERMFPAAASAASIFRSTALTVPARGVPGASNFERGVCVGRALLPALARRGLDGALLVVDVDALGSLPPNVSLVGDDGVSRLLP
jgi:hypothetical protein